MNILIVILLVVIILLLLIILVSGGEDDMEERFVWPDEIVFGSKKKREIFCIQTIMMIIFKRLARCN